MAFAQAQNLPDLYAELLVGIAGLHRSNEDYDQALNYYQQILAVQQNDGERNQQSQVHTLEAIADIYIEQGNFTTALAVLQQRLAIAQEWGEQDAVARALGGVGDVYRQLGDDKQAIDHYQQALQHYQAIGADYLDYSVGSITLSLGEIYQAQGNYDQAIQYYKDYLAIHQQRSFYWLFVFNVFSNLGSIYQDRAEYDQALSYYQQADDLAQDEENVRAQARSLAQFAGLFVAQGDIPKAMDYYEQAIATSEIIRAKIRADNPNDPVPEQDFNEQFEDIYQDFAQLLNQQGRTEEAEAVLELLSIPEID